MQTDVPKYFSINLSEFKLDILSHVDVRVRKKSRKKNVLVNSAYP